MQVRIQGRFAFLARKTRILKAFLMPGYSWNQNLCYKIWIKEGTVIELTATKTLVIGVYRRRLKHGMRTRKDSSIPCPPISVESSPRFQI